MRHRKYLYWAIAIPVCLVLVILYFLLLAPSANSLVPLPISDDQKNYSAVDQQVVTDLNYQDSIAALTGKIGDYYDFALGPADNSGGGIEVIAHMKSDGHFEKIWSGQDNPPCESIGFGVPAGIVPYCYGGHDHSIVVDRSNLVRTWYTLLFNPYVKNGYIVYPQ